MATLHCVIVMFAFILFFNEVRGYCLERHKSLLLNFKHSLVIEKSPKLANWNSSTDCCLWPGVICSDTFVTGLDLSNEGISGEFNDSSPLFDLTSLTSLNLAYKEQTVIPSGIGRLVNLMNLNMSGSDFIGQIPIEISNLTRLVSLDLSSCYDLTVENPNLGMLIGNLSNLIDLRLDFVDLSSQSREWCQVLSSLTPRLQVLNLYGCGLLESIHDSLQNLTHLSIVDISYNNFSGPIPYGVFASLENLTSLTMTSCEFSGVFPHTMLQLPTLRFLDISRNGDLEASSSITFQNSSLETLILFELRIFKTIPESIGEAKMLSYLDLGYCSLSGQIPKSISQLEHLAHLYLSHNNLDGHIPSFSRSRNLTDLDLSYNQLNRSILATDWKKLHQMKSLILRSNNLSGSIPTSLFQTPSLKILNLGENHFTGFTDESSIMAASSSHLETIPESIGEAKMLSHLDLSFCNLFGQIPKSISQLVHLVYLNLSHNNLDGHIPSFSRSRNLTVLDLSYNHLNGSILATDWKQLPQMETLLLESNEVSGSIPACLFETPSLIILGLEGNHFTGFTNETDVKASLSNLAKLSLRGNDLQGPFPPFIYGLSSLEALDLSFNNIKEMFQKEFPPFMSNKSTLGSLALSDKQIDGQIAGQIWNMRALTYLDLSNNQISDHIPDQIWNMSALTYLNLSHNQLEFLAREEYSVYLEILDLSSNKLHGSIPESICNMTGLLILDLSNNFLSGTLPQFWAFWPPNLSVLNLSKNNINGITPLEMGMLKFLYVLNMSHNHLSGQIPHSFGNLYSIESLDLSKNELSGNIPRQLTSLNLLLALNLSFNQLEGMIPTGRQFQTFTEASFKGNKGLCGQPLTTSCGNEGVTPNPSFKDTFISTEIGYVLGLWLVIMPLLFWSTWRKKCYKCIDKVLNSMCCPHRQK